MKAGRSMRRMTLLNLSPWILGAACLILLLVIAFFALGNFQREKALVTSAIEQKGLTLVRFINSSVSGTVRSSFTESGQYKKWEDYVQAALELAVEQPGVDRIEVVDRGGLHLLAAGKNSWDDNETIIAQLLGSISQEPGERYQTVILPGTKQRQSQAIFVARYRFPRVSPAGTPERRGQMMGRRFRHHPQFKDVADDLERIRRLAPVYVVWLDMEQFSAPLKKQFIQIVLELAAIILVGIGGTLSFITLRGLRGSEEDLGKVTVFNDILVSSLPVGLIASGGQGGVQVINGAAEKMVGAGVKDCIGQEPLSCLPGKLGELFSCNTEDPMEEIHREVQLENGVTLDVIVVPVRDQHDEPSGEVMLLRDLTKMKQLEQELQRSERLAAVGKMAAGVAHELRNPLSSIKGLALLLKTKAGAEGGETADTLVREVERLNRSIGELLDYAKPGTLECEPCHPMAIIDKTLLLLEPDLNELDISVTKDYEGELITVQADPDKIRQVLLNVLLNAIQALEDIDGERKLEIGLKEDEGRVLVSVRDNGSGIAPEAMKKIFDPYFTTKNSGTGLGLATSLKIIEEHGGTLRAESDPTQGNTTFQFTLPVS